MEADASWIEPRVPVDNGRRSPGLCVRVCAVPSAPQPLPDDLSGRPFDRGDLERSRRSQGRVRRKDIVHPYHGVHTARPPASLLEHCHAYAVRLRPGQAFTHLTAARLHGLPLPARLEQDLPLHVSAVRPASPPRTRGVVPHRLVRPQVLQPVDDLQVCAPTEAWVQLGEELSLDEAVVVADHLLTASPMSTEATRRLLALRIATANRPWSPLLRAALDLARCPVLSPGETRVRLLLVRAGIEEPETNSKVFDAVGRSLGRPDLVWRAHRLGLEYEGAGHADEEQMRIDIERREAFHDAGWDIVRASAHDLRGEPRQDALVRRIRRRLALRG